MNMHNTIGYDKGPTSSECISFNYGVHNKKGVNNNTPNPAPLATISTRANRIICTLWLQQWQSSARSLPNPDLVKAPPKTNVLKLQEGLRKAESSPVIQLRTGINGLDAFLFQARVPSVSSLSVAAA
jgi:hypothetical protein